MVNIIGYIDLNEMFVCIGTDGASLTDWMYNVTAS